MSAVYFVASLRMPYFFALNVTILMDDWRVNGKMQLADVAEKYYGKEKNLDIMQAESVIYSMKLIYRSLAEMYPRYEK